MTLPSKPTLIVLPFSFLPTSDEHVAVDGERHRAADAIRVGRIGLEAERLNRFYDRLGLFLIFGVVGQFGILRGPFLEAAGFSSAAWTANPTKNATSDEQTSAT